MLFVDSRTHRITALLFSQPPTPFQSPGFVLSLTKGWNLSIQKKILPEVYQTLQVVRGCKVNADNEDRNY